METININAFTRISTRPQLRVTSRWRESIKNL